MPGNNPSFFDLLSSDESPLNSFNSLINFKFEHAELDFVPDSDANFEPDPNLHAPIQDFVGDIGSFTPFPYYEQDMSCTDQDSAVHQELVQQIATQQDAAHDNASQLDVSHHNTGFLASVIDVAAQHDKHGAAQDSIESTKKRKNSCSNQSCTEQSIGSGGEQPPAKRLKTSKSKQVPALSPGNASPVKRKRRTAGEDYSAGLGVGTKDPDEELPPSKKTKTSSVSTSGQEKRRYRQYHGIPDDLSYLRARGYFADIGEPLTIKQIVKEVTLIDQMVNPEKDEPVNEGRLYNLLVHKESNSLRRTITALAGEEEAARFMEKRREKSKFSSWGALLQYGHWYPLVSSEQPEISTQHHQETENPAQTQRGFWVYPGPQTTVGETSSSAEAGVEQLACAEPPSAISAPALPEEAQPQEEYQGLETQANSVSVEPQLHCASADVRVTGPDAQSDLSPPPPNNTESSSPSWEDGLEDWRGPPYLLPEPSEALEFDLSFQWPFPLDTNVPFLEALEKLL